MPAPFYNNIKGTTAGTPGTGAFTPNAASSGYSAWSTVPTGWIGLVRYEDGSSWELSYSYWNGTTLSRASTQFFSSSSGSQLSLTSSATAALVPDGYEIQPHLGDTTIRGWLAQSNSTSQQTLAVAGVTVTGTAASAGVATTNYLTEQHRNQITSVTTANGQAGWTSTTYMLVSTAAGRGGFEFSCRFGASTLPTGPRLVVGVSTSSYAGSTVEPSSVTADSAFFGLDSTDTSIQLMVNSNVGGHTKTSTGIALVANGYYRAKIWCEPGSNTVNALLVREDTGAIWFGTTSTDVPSNGSIHRPTCIGSLNGTNTGTAFVMNISSMIFKSGM